MSSARTPRPEVRRGVLHHHQVRARGGREVEREVHRVARGRVTAGRDGHISGGESIRALSALVKSGAVPLECLGHVHI